MTLVTKQVDVQKISPCITYNLQNNPITVFKERKSQVKFAAQIATLKNAQDDSEPFFVMNIDQVNELLDVWTKNLPLVQPFYSTKCNFDPVFLRILAAHPSVGFNCAAQKEIEAVLDIASPERLLCSNPCWTGSALRDTLAHNISLLCFESERDLDRILNNHANANLLLHICTNPNSEDPNALFGCPPDSAPALLQLASELGLRCVGISFSVGNDCNFRPAYFADAIEISSRLFQIGSAFGHPMHVLNIGDGFTSSQNEYQYAQFTELCSHINHHLSIHGFLDERIRLMATPGSFFAGSAYSLITNVIDKRSVDAVYVTSNENDSGNEAYLYQINDGYFGSFGCRIMDESNPVCTPLFDGDESFPPKNVYGTVIGQMGMDEEEADVIQQVCHFRQLNIGDWLIWADMGAYTLGNRGAIDDETATSDLKIFYFSSHQNWACFSPCLFDPPTFDESDAGSYGESTLQTDTEDEQEGEKSTRKTQQEEEEGEDKCNDDWLGMFGWSFHSTDAD